MRKEEVQIKACMMLLEVRYRLCMVILCHVLGVESQRIHLKIILVNVFVNIAIIRGTINI